MLLKSTQKKYENKPFENKAKGGCKTILNYDAFHVNRKTGQKIQRIGKTLAGMSIKRGCLCCFVVKRPYLHSSLCQLIYEHIEHTHKDGEPCHGSTVAGFRHALGFNISEDVKLHIEHMHALGLSPAQIMSQHKQNMKELAK